MAKPSDPLEFQSVAAFMRATGLTDAELAKLLDVDRTEVTKLRNGRVYRSLVKPLRISRLCKVPIERLAPPSAA